MSKGHSFSCALQSLAIVKVADAAAIAAAETLDGHKMLSYHPCYAAFQVPGCPGYEHLDQGCAGEKMVYMPSPAVSGALQYLYMAVHPLASPWPPSGPGIGIVSRGEIDRTQGPDADLLSHLQK